MNILGIILGVVLGCAVLFGLTFGVRRYLGVGWGRASVFLVAAIAAGIFGGFIRAHEPAALTPLERWDNSNESRGMAYGCAGLLTSILLLFAIKLYSKWIAGTTNELEKRENLDGIRAWLGAANVSTVAILAILAWLAFDYPPLGIGLLGLLVLLIYPGIRSASAHARAQAPAPAADPNAPERQRVLNMLDNGKITAAECAELLAALNYSEKTQSIKQSPASSQPPGWLPLVGAAVLLIGFFLPWFTVRPAREFSQTLQRLAPLNSPFIQNFDSATTVHIAGGDVSHGLGWLVLALGVAVAAFPYFAGNLSPTIRQRCILAGLGVGLFVLLYLATNNLRFVSAGLLLATAGYLLQLASVLRGGQYLPAVPAA